MTTIIIHMDDVYVPLVSFPSHISSSSLHTLTEGALYQCIMVVVIVVAIRIKPAARPVGEQTSNRDQDPSTSHPPNVVPTSEATSWPPKLEPPPASHSCHSVDPLTTPHHKQRFPPPFRPPSFATICRKCSTQNLMSINLPRPRSQSFPSLHALGKPFKAANKRVRPRSHSEPIVRLEPVKEPHTPSEADDSLSEVKSAESKLSRPTPPPTSVPPSRPPSPVLPEPAMPSEPTVQPSTPDSVRTKERRRRSAMDPRSEQAGRASRTHKRIKSEIGEERPRRARPACPENSLPAEIFETRFENPFRARTPKSKGETLALFVSPLAGPYTARRQ